MPKLKEDMMPLGERVSSEEGRTPGQSSEGRLPVKDREWWQLHRRRLRRGSQWEDPNMLSRRGCRARRGERGGQRRIAEHPLGLVLVALTRAVEVW